MFFTIDPQNGIPIWDQVTRQVKFAIAKGTLRAGDRIPSVRDLAKELVINPNTISRSYQSLQGEGILESVRGIGLRVAVGAKGHCVKQRREMFRERMTQVLSEACQSGLAAEEIQRLYERSLSIAQQESQS